MDIHSLLEEAKDLLRPDLQELASLTEFIHQLEELIKKTGIEADCITGGSVGKGTYIKGDFDVDIFVRFDKKYASEDLSMLLAKILQPLKPELIHGSRDYFQIRKKLLFEIIPVLKVNRYTDAKNVTDMSPLHVTWVRNNIAKKPALADEIRLAKQFCKSKGIYGAESYIQGFSGHVLDILVTHYGSFPNLLAQAKQWKEKKIIDIELHLDNPERELNPAKRISPLILVDPLQPLRNAAAAVSEEKYERFKEEAARFLENPSLDDFALHPLTQNRIKEIFSQWKKKEDILGIQIMCIPKVEKLDVAGVKIKKVFEFLKKRIEQQFTILDSGWEFKIKESPIYFVIKNEEISEFEERQGPPISNKKFYQAFLAKHPNEQVYVKGKHINVLIKRKHRTLEPYVNELLLSTEVTERIEKIKHVRFL